MEASALQASVGIGRNRIAIGASFLRIRSDEQLVTLFREGNDDAFRVIHDRYRPRIFAYTRQMLSGTSQDPEDALQEIFMRAYYGLRAHDRELALRAWLYRIAHNRCVDDLRRPQAIAVEEIDAIAHSVQDPVAKVEERDALRRLIADVQRLPDQQRSALLMRELTGMSYADVSGALGVSVPAVKSLLVRARVSLAQANEARDTACAQIREDVVVAHDRGVRTSGLARRHMRDCSECREFRAEVRGVTRSLAAVAPTLGPLGVIAKLIGIGGGAGGGAAASGAGASGAGASAAAAGGAAGTGAAAGGAVGTGAAASASLLGASHVVTILAAAVVTAGGAVELQKTLSAAPVHRVHHHAVVVAHHHPVVVQSAPTGGASVTAQSAEATGAANSVGGRAVPPAGGASGGAGATRAAPGNSTKQLPLSETLDPDNLLYANSPVGLTPGSTTGVTTPPGTVMPGSVGTVGTGTGATGTGATGTGDGTPNMTGTPTGTGTGNTTGTGSTGTGSTGTGSTGTTGTGSTGTGSTGTTGTGSTGTGSTGTGSTGTGSTGTTGTGSTGTGSTGTTGTGSTGTGSTGTTGTGATSTGSTGTGSTATGSTGSGSTGTTVATTGSGAFSGGSSVSTARTRIRSGSNGTKRHGHRRPLDGRLQ